MAAIKPSKRAARFPKGTSASSLFISHFFKRTINALIVHEVAHDRGLDSASCFFITLWHKGLPI
jgi:hypothetical protein